MVTSDIPTTTTNNNNHDNNEDTTTMENNNININININNEKKVTISLHDYQVTMDPEARQLLLNQLMNDHDDDSNSNNNSSSNNSDHDDDMTNEKKSTIRLQNIFTSLKVAPKISLCRIQNISHNRPSSSSSLSSLTTQREQIMQNLALQLKEQWDLSHAVDIVIRPHWELPDVIEIITKPKTINNNNNNNDDDDDDDQKDEHDEDSSITSQNLAHYSVPPLSSSSNTTRITDRMAWSCQGDTTTTTSTVTSSRTRSSLGWPLSHRVIVCDRFCAEAVLRGSHIYVKGILCADAGIRKGDEVAVYGFVAHRAVEKKPLRGSAISVLQHGPCIFLGLGYAHCDRSQFFSTSVGIGVIMSLRRAGPILPPLHDIMIKIMSSQCMMQNLPSLYVAHALRAQPGHAILDMCSAPGGKTTHVASLIQQQQQKQNGNTNDTIIVACDKSRAKIMALQNLLVHTMGGGRENEEENDGPSTTISNSTTPRIDIIPLVLDATKCVLEHETRTLSEILASAKSHRLNNNNNVDQQHDHEDTAHNNTGPVSLSDDSIIGFPPLSFDRILLDPPCSALGLRPKLMISYKAKELQTTAEYQRLFIRQAVQLLKPGGIMTYSTCTMNALENEGNVMYIVQEYGHVMTLIPWLSQTEPSSQQQGGQQQQQRIMSHGQPGFRGMGLTEEQRHMVRRFDPSNQQDDCMGFFIAKFQKKMKTT